MKRMSTQESYSVGSKYLHWIIAVLITLMLTLSFFLEDLSKSSQPTGYMLHKSVGLTILALMLIRIYWIKHTGRPPLPVAVPKWERYFSRFIQYTMYVAILAMALSGWSMSVAANRIPTYFNLFSVPLPLKPNESLAELLNSTHKTLAWVMIALIALHIAGALKHHFIDRDNVLKRMLPH